jgi:hypothetical protein
MIISLTPIARYASINKESVKNNMASAYWLFDGIHSMVSWPEDELESSDVIEQLFKSQPDTQNVAPEQGEPEETTQPDDV